MLSNFTVLWEPQCHKLAVTDPTITNKETLVMAFFNAKCLLRECNVEQIQKLTQRCLIHAIHQTHLDNEKVQH